ncbi:hypothetical protein CupriaWKF_19605 [Cupriavidus sp. WKF15]|uniref:hypothetical protein n=1 Tax=Cupriavidus sp. WKF15 TaxID=3032282 RepID=UPI0023E24CC6|nr:hypothetical protein [Cupriavidus sp. WKF15]WER50236.1 hypothetical protein CupriaWKF_19605 [Cupriavidus sp. WKF15]
MSRTFAAMAICIPLIAHDQGLYLHSYFLNARLHGVALCRALQSCCCNMKRFLAFSLVAWLAAALLILGRDSASMIALSGVVALAGLDIFQP